MTIYPRTATFASLLVLVAFWSACGGKSNRPPATSTPRSSTGTIQTAPPRATSPPPPTPMPVDSGDDISAMSDPDRIHSRTLEEINADSPIQDVHFEFDSADLREVDRARLDEHAQWLLRYSTVTVLIEGHCDERGTVEYNLALGERRATAIYSYLSRLGVPAGRLKTISYGKEFPLDPAHTESAWARNRRGHFEITAK